MHQKPADKFNTGDGILLPPAFFTVVFHIEGNGILVNTNDTMIADGNPVGVFSQVVDNGLCTVKGFLTMRNPVFLITDVHKFLECIVVTVLKG